MRTFLYWLTSYLPCRIICDGDKPYLERYYLWTLFGARWYVHRFVASDPDRGLHSHPWRWAISFILCGWYFEQTHYGTSPVRWLNALTGDSFHRVILPKDLGVHECWTVFVHKARREKSWGFLRDKGQLGIVYLPQRPGIEEHWWKTCPRGRYESRRMPR